MAIIVSNNNDNGIGSLRQAILDAVSGNFIEFESDYEITLTSGEIVIEKNVTINSLGKEITISGNDAGRVFTISEGVSVAINRFLITKGYSLDGGAILNLGTVTITNRTLSYNTGTREGGGAILNLGTVTITNSTLSYNTSTGVGGAIANNSGTIAITNSTLSANTCTAVDGGAGGAIANYGGTIAITNSTLSANTCTAVDGGVGGAIENSHGTVTITNSTLSANTCVGDGGAGGAGGAIYNSGILNISFSTIAFNQGNGIFNFEIVNCKNSILFNNGSANYLGRFDSTLSASGVNFSTDDTCPNFTKKSADALKLGPLALNAPGTTATHALLRGSVAIDTVMDYRDLSGNVVATDQRGVSRPQGPAGDAGAYQYTGVTIYVSNDFDSGTGSLRQAILDAYNSDFIEFESDYEITLTSGEIVIEKNVTINSLGKEITINGNLVSRVFRILLDASLTINHFTITNGYSLDSGGAIFNYMGLVIITNSTLSNNICVGDGGAIFNDIEGIVTITNSTFSANSCGGNGGAIENYGGTVTITNSTLSANTSAGNGGAIENWYATLNISFSTIAFNQGEKGAGIFNTGKGDFSTSSVDCKNSILANNGRANYVGEDGGTLSASGVNYSTDGTCSGFIEKSADALKLGPLALNAPGTTATHALLRGSAAIDTVMDYRDLSGNVVATDQRGVSRPQGIAGDAGAYEFVPDRIRGISFF